MKGTKEAPSTNRRFSDEVEHELRAKGLLPFVLRTECDPSKGIIMLAIYENQRWHPILKSWGGVVGVHLSPVFDRRPLSDDFGLKSITGELDDIKPLNKHRWSGDWGVWTEDTVTDSAGYQYSHSWQFMNSKARPAATQSATSFVRRRLWKRSMELDSVSTIASKTMPYELVLTVKHARILNGGSTSHCHVDVALGGSLLMRTASSQPDWNAVLRRGFMSLDPDSVLRFRLYTKKAFHLPGVLLNTGATVSSLSSTPSSSASKVDCGGGGGDSDNEGCQLRGEASLIVGKPRGPSEHVLDLLLPGSKGRKGAVLVVEVELRETNVFSIVPTHTQTVQQLHSLVGQALTPALKQRIAALDSDAGELLRIVCSIIIEGRDVLTEADIADVVDEVAFVERINTRASQGKGTGKGAHAVYTGHLTPLASNVWGDMKYPHGCNCFSKLLAIPSEAMFGEATAEPVGRKGEGAVAVSLQQLQLRQCRAHVNSLLQYEVDLHLLNQRTALMQPSCSSVLNLTYDGARTYDASRYGPAGECADCFDLTILCTTPAVDHDPASSMAARAAAAATGTQEVAAHVLRLDNYFEYLQLARELSKVQHQAHKRQPAEHVLHSTIALYGPTSVMRTPVRSAGGAAGSLSLGTSHGIGSFGGVASGSGRLASNLCSGSGIPLPTRWQRVRLTVDTEAECFVLSEADMRSDGSDAQVALVLLPFDQVAGVILHNTHHLHAHYVLEMHVMSLSAFSLQHNYTSCSVEVDSTDGRVHLQSAWNPTRRVLSPKQHPTTVVFQDTHSVLLPPHSLTKISTGHALRRSDAGAGAGPGAGVEDEYLHITVRADAHNHGKSGSGSGEVLSGEALPLRELFSRASSSVVESKLQFKNMVEPFELKLHVLSAQGLVPVDLGGTSDPYFVVYLADAAGEVISPKGTTGPTTSLTARVLHKTQKVLVGAAAKERNNAVYCSKTISRNLNPEFNEEVLISTEKHLAALRSCKYVLLQFFDSNVSRSDQCLGELYLPIHAAAHRSSSQGRGSTAEADWQRRLDATGSGRTRLDVQTLPLQLSQFMDAHKYSVDQAPSLGTVTLQFTRFGRRLAIAQQQSLLRQQHGGPEGTHSGDSDLLNLQLTLTLKPLGAMDFAWPLRVLASGSAPASVRRKGVEEDEFHADLSHDGLCVHFRNDEPAMWGASSSTSSARVKMLTSCKEYCDVGHHHTMGGAVHGAPGGGGNYRVVRVPYTQIHANDVHVISTDTLLLTVILTLVASPSQQRGSVRERSLALDLVMGPCPAADVYCMLLQRIALHTYRSTISRFHAYGSSAAEVDAIAVSLQRDIHAAASHVQQTSAQRETALLTNALKVASNVGGSMGGLQSQLCSSDADGDDDTDGFDTDATTGPTDEVLRRSASFGCDDDGVGSDARMAAGTLFSDADRRMSVLYWLMSLPTRVDMVRMAFLRVYFWFLLKYSCSPVATAGGSIEEAVDNSYIDILIMEARSLLRYGDPNRTVRDGNDSDDDSAAPPSEEAEEAEVSIMGNLGADSLVRRVEEVMQRLDSDLRALLFQSYRSDEVMTMANALVYGIYLVIVGYFTETLVEDINEDAHAEEMEAAAADSSGGGGIGSDGKKLKPKYIGFGYHVVNLAHSATRGINEVIAAATGPMKDARGGAGSSAGLQRVSRLSPQKKRDLIAFVIAKDRLLEDYLGATLFSHNFKFSSPPVLSRCLDFDVLVRKFSLLLSKNILMWNKKALRVVMCRPSVAGAAAAGAGAGGEPKVDEARATTRVHRASSVDEALQSISLPWDVDTYIDHKSGCELYVSHIPATIQTQLNVLIDLKRIPLRGVRDSLSLASIWRVLSINRQIVAAVAKAYVTLATEYEYHLVHVAAAADGSLAAAQNQSGAGKGQPVRKFLQTIGTKLLVADVARHAFGDVHDPAGAGAVAAAATAGAPILTAKDSDDLLCFLMSVINDCQLIVSRHIPQSIRPFVDDYIAADVDLLVEDAAADAAGAGESASGRDSVSAAAGEAERSGALGSIDEISSSFSGARQALDAVSDTAINYLSSQILFHSELREYFLNGFEEHLVRREEPAKLHFPVLSHLQQHRRHQHDHEGREQLPHMQVGTVDTAPSSDSDAEGEHGADGVDAEHGEMGASSPVAVVNATLTEFYEFVHSHVDAASYKRVVVSCLKKLALRYLLFLRDLMAKARATYHGSPLFHSDSHAHAAGEGPAGKFNGNDLNNALLSAAQIQGVQADLKAILSAYLEMHDQSCAEMLRFLNTTVIDVISGSLPTPEALEKLLQMQFHAVPPPFQADRKQMPAYEASLEQFIGVDTSFRNLSDRELRGGQLKCYRIQFSEFSCVRLDDYRVVVLRVTLGGQRRQTSILQDFQVGLPTVHWKEQLEFEHVQGYASEVAVVEVVEIRPLKLRRELVLVRLVLELSELGRFLRPESPQLPQPQQPRRPSAGAGAGAGAGGGHAGWYVMEDVRLQPGNASPFRIARTKLRRALLSPIVAGVKTGVQVAAVAAAAVGANGAESGSGVVDDGDAGGGGTGGRRGSGAEERDIRLSSYDAHSRTKNSYLSVLTSDKPRDIPATQVHFRARIFEEADPEMAATGDKESAAAGPQKQSQL